MSGKRRLTLWTPERLKNLRRLYGEHFGKKTETQAELAARLGVAVSTLEWWERGKGEPSGPSARLLDRLEEDIRAGKPRELQPA
jgi:transcriptional regulator with XRE-family HTH domain